MRYIYLISLFVFFVETSFSSSLLCSEILRTKVSTPNAAAEFYRGHSELGGFFKALEMRGVLFEFIDPSLGASFNVQILKFQPTVLSRHDQGPMVAHETTVLLPMDISLAGQGAVFEIKTLLSQMHKIFVLQNQGAIFSYEEGRVTLHGFRAGSRVTDPTLHTLRYLINSSDIKKVVFEGNEFFWDQNGYLPDSKIVINYKAKDELWVRRYYFDRAEYWEQFPMDLETKVFRFVQPQPFHVIQ